MIALLVGLLGSFHGVSDGQDSELRTIILTRPVPPSERYISHRAVFFDTTLEFEIKEDLTSGSFDTPAELLSLKLANEELIGTRAFKVAHEVVEKLNQVQVNSILCDRKPCQYFIRLRGTPSHQADVSIDGGDIRCTIRIHDKDTAEGGCAPLEE